MLSILFPEINWDRFDYIGFDLDGTLYDEFDFIEQVYEKIASKLTERSIKDDVVEYMKVRWLQKGSSYPKIFGETENKFTLKDFELNALEIFRNHIPSIKLSKRTSLILNEFRKKSNFLFLITDGKEILQKNKLKSLRIKSLFKEIIVTEDYPKPSKYYGRYIIKKYNLKAKKVIFLGDREVDRKFAENCGFEFLKTELWNYKLIK